jgi:hypothetical protein
MFCDLLCEKNNLQLQLSDFENEESIKALQTTNFHFYSSGPNKDKNTMHTMGVNSDSMFDFIELP